jgi:serine/threonine protein kinase
MTHTLSASTLVRNRRQRLFGSQPSPDGVSRRQRALLRLEHPAIASMQVARNGGETWLIDNEPPGPSLADLLEWRRATPFGLREILDLLRPVIDGLEHAAGHGVAHGGLHPGAIIDAQDGPVLIGFDGSPAPLAYRAPEWTPGHRSRRADVFALGVMIYELLIGQPPNEEAERWRMLPPGVDRVLARALSNDPRRRYRSAHTFFKALESCQRQHRSDSHEAPMWRRYAVIAIVLAAVLAVSAVAGMLVGMLL